MIVKNNKLASLELDLSQLQVDDIEVFFQQGSKGLRSQLLPAARTAPKTMPVPANKGLKKRY